MSENIRMAVANLLGMANTYSVYHHHYIKSTCFNFVFWSLWFANDFLNGCYNGCTWFFLSFSLRNNTTSSAACTCRNCRVTRVYNTCGVGCICDTCGVACLCSNCDLACIHNSFTMSNQILQVCFGVHSFFFKSFVS